MEIAIFLRGGGRGVAVYEYELDPYSLLWELEIIILKL